MDGAGFKALTFLFLFFYYSFINSSPSSTPEGFVGNPVSLNLSICSYTLTIFLPNFLNVDLMCFFDVGLTVVQKVND